MTLSSVALLLFQAPKMGHDYPVPPSSPLSKISIVGFVILLGMGLFFAITLILRALAGKPKSHDSSSQPEN